MDMKTIWFGGNAMSASCDRDLRE